MPIKEKAVSQGCCVPVLDSPLADLDLILLKLAPVSLKLNIYLILLPKYRRVLKFLQNFDLAPGCITADCGPDLVIRSNGEMENVAWCEGLGCRHLLTSTFSLSVVMDADDRL